MDLWHLQKYSQSQVFLHFWSEARDLITGMPHCISLGTEDRKTVSFGTLKSCFLVEDVQN